MKNLLYLFFSFLSLSVLSQQTLTLEACYDLAEKNYPLAKQINLWEEKSKSEVEIIQKGKLPQLDLNAQATYQSDVIQFPLNFPNATIQPPNKDQYRASLDVNQLIFNGGLIAANTKLQEAELQTQQQQVAVNLYQLRAQINQSYFSVLFYQEQTKLQNSKMEELNSRLKEIESGVKYGAILLSTKQVLQAEMLKLKQHISETEFSRKKTLENLAILINQNIDNTTELAEPKLLTKRENDSKRPEVKLFDLKQNQLETSQELISKAKYPNLAGFAQLGYGNPGLNMLDNSFQEFYIVGLKLSWNVFDWGKTKAQHQSVEISKEIISTEKETFVLNNLIQLKEAQNDIDKYEEILQSDAEIIDLREQVLKVALSQFKNGAINSSDYITELNHLYEAKIAQKLNGLQLNLAKANYIIIKGN